MSNNSKVDLLGRLWLKRRPLDVNDDTMPPTTLAVHTQSQI